MSICRRSPGAFPARPSPLFGTSTRVPLAGMHAVQGSIGPVRVIPRCRADSLKIGSDKWPARSWNTLISTRLRSLPTWKGSLPGPKMANARSSLSCIIRSELSQLYGIRCSLHVRNALGSIIHAELESHGVGLHRTVSSSSSNSMGEDITTLEDCTRSSSQRGTGGGMQAADTNALLRETPTGIGGGSRVA